jgi:AcrR family transcriptional regulator
MARQSLRERQRLAITEEIQETSIRMFLERGYEGVAVSDIAEAAGVSDRTFYRYFPTKEDVVLVALDEVAPIVHRHLREHEGEDRPWKVLCDAFVLSGRTGSTIDPKVMRMVYETPKLLSAYFERQRAWESQVAEVIAERLGVDVVRDPRPQLWSMMAFDIGYRVGFENVMLNPNSDLAAGFEERFLQAEQLFSGRLP